MELETSIGYSFSLIKTEYKQNKIYQNKKKTKRTVNLSFQSALCQQSETCCFTGLKQDNRQIRFPEEQQPVPQRSAIRHVNKQMVFWHRSLRRYCKQFLPLPPAAKTAVRHCAAAAAAKRSRSIPYINTKSKRAANFSFSQISYKKYRSKPFPIEKAAIRCVQIHPSRTVLPVYSYRQSQDKCRYDQIHAGSFWLLFPASCHGKTPMPKTWRSYRQRIRRCRCRIHDPVAMHHLH